MAEISPRQGTKSQWVEDLLFFPISKILSLSYLGNCGRPRLDDLGLKKDRPSDLSSQTWSRIDWRRDSSSEPLIQYRKSPLMLSKCLSPSTLFVKYLAERPRSLLDGWSFSLTLIVWLTWEARFFFWGEWVVLLLDHGIANMSLCSVVDKLLVGI